MSLKGKKILITGGLGFIGSNLAKKLVKENADVTLMDSMIEEYGANIFNIDSIKNDVKINFSDMRDEVSLKYLVKNKDYIFNLAGQVSHQDSMTNPIMDLDVNIRAQVSLLETCRKYCPETVIVYSSTRQIYGKPQYLPVDEKHPILPPDVNGINKLAAENYHSLYNNVYGLKTISFRLTNTYGPRQLIKNARQGFIGWFVNRAIQGEKIQLFGTGEQLRDFNDIDDVVDALCLVFKNENLYGNVYNLSGEISSLKKVAERLIEYSGKGTLEIVPFPDERKKIDIGDFYGDSSKLSKATGWKPKVSLADGLKKMTDFYKLNYKNYID